jgi:hypothetical protein
MARYSSEIKNKARILWLSGMVKNDEEIAAQCGIKNARVIKKWREEQKWEQDLADNLAPHDKDACGSDKQHKPSLSKNFVVIDEAIKFLIERISQGEIKGSFSDLDKLLRLKAFLIEQQQKTKQAKTNEGLSNEELDKEIEATRARIMELERKMAEDKKGKK